MKLFGSRCRPVVALRFLTMTAIAALVAAMYLPRIEHFWRGFCDGVALGVLIALLLSLFSPEVRADIEPCEPEFGGENLLEPRQKP